MWVYYSLLKDPGRRDDARKLLLALWDYYSTDEQTTRFSNIIKNPVFAGDPMEMPHIRFDSNSTNLGDVIVDGKPEVWNHRQIDAHGLFFTALAEAVGNKIIDHNDLTVKRFKVLSLYPLFLEKIKFYYYEDAGAWEELPRKNTSSIGLATRSLQVWKKLLYNDTSSEAKAFRRRFDILSDKKDKKITKAWSDGNLQKLIENGLKTVRRQLFLGGESPDYKTDDIRFRLADAALGVLIVPSTLDGISEEELRKALLIIETLKRPAGILRYDNDSYQGGNYWIQKPGQTDKDKPTLTGDTSSKDAFLWRLSKLIPDTEAEWFFDSFVALSYLRLAEITKNTKLKEEDLHFAVVHLKRALGQITGKSIASDGKSVRPWQTPESINTVVIDDHRYYLPSPITPLNWAKASLSMALKEYEKALKRQP